VETRQTKQDLAEDLKEWYRDTKGIIPCSILISESSTFIRYDTGGIGHEDGKFDDCVMGAGCTLQADKFLGGSPKQVGKRRLEEKERKKQRQQLEPSHQRMWGELDRIVAQQELEAEGW
jgi:hypothetical protein